jgi:aminoglycoside 6'-N-acetyltransferase
VVLRRAVTADVPLLERWDEDPDVADSGGDDDNFDWGFEVPREVDWREILVAEADGEAVGVVVLIDAAREETHYWGDSVEPGAWAIDIWIGEERDRSRGIGRQMMEGALARCFGPHGAPVVLIDPLTTNVRAIRFYERMGFSHVGPRRFGEDDCSVMQITPGAPATGRR